MLACLLTMGVLGAMPASATQPGPMEPATKRVRSEINLILELHDFLMVATEGEENQRPEYLTEINAYKQAREMITDPRAWRFVNDTIVEGPDTAAIAKRAQSPPASLSPADVEGVKKLLQALSDAWPRFEAQDLVAHRRALQVVLTSVLRRQFSGALEKRIMPAVYDKMRFKPIDAPVIVYPVVNAVEIGVSGKTSKGYYVVIPVSRRPNLRIIEMVVHEVTHVLDARQPTPSSSILARIRRAAARATPRIDDEVLEGFLHGLVAFNAGEMIRRFVRPDYRPLVDVSANLRSHIDAFRSAYEGPWIEYLDGKLSPEQVIEQMIAFLKPSGKS
ncbi:MAG: hypothetical protein ACE5HU_05055 [Acidobacteriota bacterium]